MSMKLDLETYLGMDDVFCRLNNLRRWPSVINQGHFNELSKQALNWLTSYVIAAINEENGQEIQWERFPRIAIFRAFKRACLYYETVEAKWDKILPKRNIPKEELNVATRDIIRDNTSRKFMKFVSQDCGTPEMRIFKAATKVATYIEVLEMMENGLNGRKITKRLEEVKNGLAEYMDMPGVKYLLTEGNEVFPVLMEIAGLRNSNRWAARSYGVDCNVLGHLFDTAVYAYLIALEKFDGMETVATKFFFMGIWHDVAEAWTGDMPSDTKNRVSGLREATEDYEDEELEENIYSKFPPFLVAKIREVMFEEESNQQYFKLMKGADYLSADSECYRQYLAGSNDPYFYTSAMVGLERDLSIDKVRLTPCARELHEWFMKYAEDHLKTTGKMPKKDKTKKKSKAKKSKKK